MAVDSCLVKTCITTTALQVVMSFARFPRLTVLLFVRIAEPHTTIKTPVNVHFNCIKKTSKPERRVLTVTTCQGRI